VCELLATFFLTALVAGGLTVLLLFANLVVLQVIMQMFHWTRNPSQAAKIAQRKEEIYDSIMNGVQPAEVPGVRSYLDTLRNYNVSAGGLMMPQCFSGLMCCCCGEVVAWPEQRRIYPVILSNAMSQQPTDRMLHYVYWFLQIPVALATAQPERRVKPAIDRLNLANYFDAVVTAEDNGSPEVSRHVMWWIASADKLSAASSGHLVEKQQAGLAAAGLFVASQQQEESLA
jgi:hypothetical protein